MFKREIGKLVWDGKQRHTPRRFLMRNKRPGLPNLKDQLMDNVIFYDNGHVFDKPVSKCETQVCLIEGDTFTIAKLFEDTCCLNFASDKHVGGAYLVPEINAQEEDLFRRSNLPILMDNDVVKSFYPLVGLQGFYCPDVIVNRDSDLEFQTPFNTSVITLPAVRNPKPGEEQLVKDKIKRVFQIAADNEVKNFILGAFGCGVFRNAPQFVANAFKDLIKGEFKDVFASIIFAIPDAEGDNYKVFDSLFNQSLWSE